MPTYCCIKSCHNYSTKTYFVDISYHRFPKNEEIRKKWIKLCGGNINPNTSRVCSIHFKENNFKRDLQRELTGEIPRKMLMEDAVPTILMKREDSERGDDRIINTEVLEIKEEKEASRNIEENLEHLKKFHDVDNEISSNEIDYKKLYDKLLQQHNKLISEYEELQDENQTIKKQLKNFENHICCKIDN